jgi:hypothetical protein
MRSIKPATTTTIALTTAALLVFTASVPAVRTARANANQTNWAPVPIVAPPKARRQHGMVYDSALRQIVMFGGICDCDLSMNDLWSFNGVAWTQIYTDGNTIGPSQRVTGGSSTGIAFDERISATLLFGGLSPAGTLSDTWLLERGSWRAVKVDSAIPPARAGHAIASLGGKFAMFGGTADSHTWLFDGSTWVSRTYTLAPERRVDHGMAFDAARNRAVLFGGYITGGSGPTSTQLLSDTWEFTEAAGWRKITPAISPSPRYGFAMAYDPFWRVMRITGGVGVDTKPLSDTWEFNGSNWLLVDGGVIGQPAPRYGAAMAFDASTSKHVLFGGIAGNAVSNGTTAAVFSDTWRYQGPTLKRAQLLPVALNNAPQPLREVEDNDSIPTANALPLNTELRGITDDTRDIFIVRPETSGTITITLTGLPQAADTRVQLQVFQGATTIANDADAPYQALIPNPSGEYVVVVFTDKTNYAPNSTYVLKAAQ